RLADQFRTEVWPLLTRTGGGQKSCVGCHDDSEDNTSSLEFPIGPDEVFATLLADGYLDADNPLSLLSKVTHVNRRSRMPPRPGAPWPAEDVATLRRFLSDLDARRGATTVPADETFPPALLVPYEGPRPDEGPSNTFLSFRQLRGRIQTIFHDDWRRDERD